MKLRTRITAIAVIVILLAAAVSDGMIWMICRSALLRETEQSALQKIFLLHADYQSLQRQTKEEPDNAALRFLFKQRNDDYLICLRNTEAVYNQTVLTPADLLQMKTAAYEQDPDFRYGYLQKNGHRLLISQAGTQNHIMLFAVNDLSRLTNRLRMLALGMLGVLLCVSVPAMILLYLLLRRTLRPLGTLSARAKAIAAGAYDERTDITGSDEIGMLARDFDLMAGAVQEKIRTLADSEQRKTMFMADFSHELKTPLTAISGYAQTLLTVRLSEEDRTEALRFIDSESKRLDRLSKKMMRLMQLDRTEALQMTEISCESLLQKVIASVQPAAAQKGTALQIGRCSGVLRCEPDLVHDAVYNLAENAIKASSPGQCVELSAENGVIAVADSGCGIPQDEIPNLTEPFYMVDKSRSRETGGAGLGLSLVAQIMQLHGGRIEIESEAGAGTTVKLHFIYTSLNT